MAEIQQNRYDQLLRRVTNVVAAGSIVNDTLSELFPMFDVENMPAELLALAGTRVCFGGGVLTSIVGESPTMQIFNPLGSGMLMTVTKAMLSHSTSSTTAFWGIVSEALATAIDTQNFRDTRFGLAASSLPVGTIRTRSAVQTANSIGQTKLLANTPLQLDDENGLAVLIPGSGFEMGVSQTNAKINVVFYWRERVAEPAELNL